MAARGMASLAQAERPAARWTAATREGLAAAPGQRGAVLEASELAAVLRVMQPLLGAVEAPLIASEAEMTAAPEWVGDFQMSSVLKKRRKKMTKHKLRKRRKKDRYKNK
ncbi:Hypothetical Protein FCC1311_060892 [Hondaea fermentalgiana]|uniref:Ribosomal protein mS38 C-terminal domain-containing protein n=1 Tax=Hondaea fermentalgiana TaxID=2315210 RepID=A0A2R5GHQ4_9STRA|nr:Hypothetical Protein FCC1311_060892 [Hondaea fermentalgiana]|eukprot:GBG29869.1 Hypothetical Protein FCC1311_060892 [Hondaea fermentalgiana]